MHTHRRPRPRVLGALALLTAATAGLTACGSSSGPTTGVGASSPVPVVSASPTGGITPGGPAVTTTPTPTSVPTQGSPGARGIPIDNYSASGTVLTVYYHAGVCDKYGVTADQSQPGKVLARIVVTRHAPTGQMCPMVITPQHASVDLGQPLDGRTVIDASDGSPVAPVLSSGVGMESHGPGPAQ